MSKSVETAAPIEVSSEALEIVLQTRAQEDDPENTALKVTVTGATMTDYTYELELVAVAERLPDDSFYSQGSHNELSVIVPQDSIEALSGSTLDVATSTNGGLVIKNPNKPNPLFGTDLELTGDVADRAKAVIESAINPALASHGGFAELIGVDDGKVYVTMGGGCQGCAASAMTLKDGIRTMLMEAIPEITEVVDATDHSAGENPFYS